MQLFLEFMRFLMQHFLNAMLSNLFCTFPQTWTKALESFCFLQQLQKLYFFKFFNFMPIGHSKRVPLCHTHTLLRFFVSMACIVVLLNKSVAFQQEHWWPSSKCTKKAIVFCISTHTSTLCFCTFTFFQLNIISLSLTAALFILVCCIITKFVKLFYSLLLTFSCHFCSSYFFAGTFLRCSHTLSLWKSSKSSLARSNIPPFWLLSRLMTCLCVYVPVYVFSLVALLWSSSAVFARASSESRLTWTLLPNLLSLLYSTRLYYFYCHLWCPIP